MISWSGQYVDGPQYGSIPPPWQVEVQYPPKFTDTVQKVRVPHTSSVKVLPLRILIQYYGFCFFFLTIPCLSVQFSHYQLPQISSVLHVRRRRGEISKFTDISGCLLYIFCNWIFSQKMTDYHYYKENAELGNVVESEAMWWKMKLCTTRLICRSKFTTLSYRYLTRVLVTFLT